jgi:outer membrane lipoprotein carrier protein
MMKRSLFTLSLAILLIFASSSVWAISLRDVINTLEEPFSSSTAEERRINSYSADFFQQSKIASLNRLQRANGRVEVAFDYDDNGYRETVPTAKFRWQYDQPTTQEIVSDGETMWVYLPENNQVIQSNVEMVNKANQNDPMTFLTGLGNLSRDFTISWAMPNQDIDGNYVLELSPIRISSLINKLIIVVDRYAVEAYQNRGKDTDPVPDPMIPPAPPAPPAAPAKTDDFFKIPGGDVPFPEMAGSPNDIWFPILSTTVYDPNGNSTIIEFSNLRVNFGISDMTFDFIIPAGVQVVRPTGKEMGF